MGFRFGGAAALRLTGLGGWRGTPAALLPMIALVCWDHLETGGVLFCHALRIQAAQGILDISRAGQAHNDLCIGTGTFDVEMNGILDNFLDAFSDYF